MKTPKPTPKPKRSGRQETADFLGQKYTDLSGQIKDLNSSRESATADIKLFAENEGTTNGDQCTVKGTKYEVGYTEVKSYGLSVEEAQKRLSKAILKELIQKKTVEQVYVDPDLFKQLVDNGTISKQDAEKILFMTGTQRRVIVRAAK